MIIAIRDDDTSFFTKPQELEAAYDFITEGCVSLSVVPFSVPYHKLSKPYGDGYEYKNYDIADNSELVEYLKKVLKSSDTLLCFTALPTKTKKSMVYGSLR